MTIDVRMITTDDYLELGRIGANSFPGGGNTVEGVAKWIEDTMESQNPDDLFYGAFQDGKLVGGTRYLNFQMNLLNQRVKIGGLGAVCVDLLHKKERVAKEMMVAFLKHYRSQKVNLTMLYPFDIPFYQNMGFGIGTWMHKFEIKPTSFPKGDWKEHLHFATEEDQEQLLECYNRIASKTNGMIFKKKFSLPTNAKTIVYQEDGQIKGYMIFGFEGVQPTYRYVHNLRLDEMLYENGQVLREFSTFLHTQADQAQRIHYITQDDSLKYFLTDPTNGQYEAFNALYLETHVTANGAMYRVTDVAGIFQELTDHNFAGQDCRLKVTVRDTLLPENAGSTVVAIEKGFIQSIDATAVYDVEIILDISDFSSLLVGGTNFKGLYKFGLVAVSDESYVDRLELIFQNDQPICVTYY